jgi:hypothetical protein
VAGKAGGLLLATRDGRHWSKENVKISPTTLWAVSCGAGSTFCAAVGDGGAIVTNSNAYRAARAP